MALDPAVYSGGGGEAARLVALAAVMLPPGDHIRSLIEHHYGSGHSGQAAGCTSEDCAKLRADTPHRQETPP